MKISVSLVIFLFLFSPGFAQNISGKWYGYAIQDTGELCQKCNFELDLSHKRNIWGESYTYQKDTTDIRFGLSGYIDKKDTIRLDESPLWVYNRMTLKNWNPCLKRYMLKYYKINNSEFLLGRGEGDELDKNNQRTGETCIPALFVFARSKGELNSYLALHRDSLLASIMPPKKEPVPEEPIPPFTSSFNNTFVNKLTEIQVEHTDLEIRLRDYLKEDDDTVSIYLNRKLISEKNRISRQTVTIKFTIRKDGLNELLLYAENLGKIPPNTSEMTIIDGKKSYRINIESDKQKTAAVYLRYKDISPERKKE